MSKKITIIIIVVLVLIIILISYFVMFYFESIKFGMLKKEIKGKNITLKSHESATVDDLVINHKDGGHAILIKGGDLSFVVLDLKVKGSKRAEELSISSTEKKFWNGYLIEAKEMEWNGESVTLSISRFQEERFEFGKEISLQKYKVVRNKDLKIAFADLEESYTVDDPALGIRIGTGDFSITLELENFSGKTGIIHFNSPWTEKTMWENYSVNFISFDPASESIKLVVLK